MKGTKSLTLNPDKNRLALAQRGAGGVDEDINLFEKDRTGVDTTEFDLDVINGSSSSGGQNSLSLS